MQLLNLRLTANLTQAQLAQRIKVNQTTISKYEKFKAKPPLEKMQKLADALNVDLVTIVDCFATKKDQN